MMDNSEKHVRWGEQLEAPPTRRSDGSRPITPIIKRRGFAGNERARSISEPSSPVVHGKFFTFNKDGEKVTLLTDHKSEDSMNNNTDEDQTYRTASFLNFEPPKAAKHVHRKEVKRKPRNNSVGNAVTTIWNEQETNDKGNDSVATGTGLANRYSNSDNADNIDWNKKKNETMRSPTPSALDNFSQIFSKDCPGIMAQINNKEINPDNLPERDENAIKEFLTKQYPPKSPKSPSSPSLSEASSEASRSTAGSEKVLTRTRRKKKQKSKTPNVASMLFVADQPSEAENLWKQYCETSKISKPETTLTQEDYITRSKILNNQWKALQLSYNNANNNNNINNNNSDSETSPTAHRTAFSDTEASDENLQRNWKRLSLRSRRSPNSKLPVLQAWDSKKERQGNKIPMIINIYFPQ
ncbi:unnamed protein product [Dimorphilus gyrociliatus]|uniref:Uncharacterized protein n=1 Tax=Dimorphilus gyrociliatus TaxID=2664684 RepID=A0A7I8W638_9ANNE|nr:unnamed protein product [Dimorphilus gyrociliatus]